MNLLHNYAKYAGKRDRKRKKAVLYVKKLSPLGWLN